MSVTNAVSGVVGIGGIHLMGGGLVPDDVPTLLAASAVFMSAVNVFGGFKVILPLERENILRNERSLIPGWIHLDCSGDGQNVGHV